MHYHSNKIHHNTLQQKQIADTDSIKNEIRGYKAFAFKKNLLEMAVAFTLANSCNKVVASLSENIFMPFIHFLTNNSLENNWRNFNLKVCNGLVFEIGPFVNSLVDFLIISILFYVIYVKFLSQVINKLGLNDDTEKICPFCQMAISNLATKCPYCTSKLETKK